MNHRLYVRYKNIELQPLNIETSQEYRLIRNKQENRKWFYYSEEISETEQGEWFKKYIENENDYMWSVIYEKVVVGGVAIYDVGTFGSYRKAEFGRLLINETSMLSHGGLKACVSACFLAFNSLKIQELILSVYKFNQKAISIYKKAGFVDIKDYEDDGVSKHMRLYKNNFLNLIKGHESEFRFESK